MTVKIVLLLLILSFVPSKSDAKIATDTCCEKEMFKTEFLESISIVEKSTIESAPRLLSALCKFSYGVDSHLIVL